MSNFIHGPEKSHCPLDLDDVTSFKLIIRTDDKWDHYISFYNSRGNTIAEWDFKNNNPDLAKLTFENIKNEVGSKNINDTVKL